MTRTATVAALRNLAHLMQADTREIYRSGRCRTDYLLIQRACYGPLMWRDDRTGEFEIARLATHRAERRAADALIDQVIEALGPDYCGLTIAEVHATADRLTAETPAG